MSTILVIPGLQGSGEDHWQTHWQSLLPDMVRVNQDDWNAPNLEAWSERIVKTALQYDEVWLLAHSFGVLASVHALEQIRERVRGVFWVAPADPEKFGVESRLPWQALSVHGALVASRNDPWLSWSRALEIADHWALPVLDAGEAGHINVASGHGDWGQGLAWFRSVYGLPAHVISAILWRQQQTLAPELKITPRKLYTEHPLQPVNSPDVHSHDTHQLIY